MILETARLVPFPGESALVARFGSVVAVCGASGDLDAIAELVDRCRVAAGEPTPGPVVTRSLAALVATRDHSRVPPFAAVAQGDDGLAVVAFGGVEVVAHGGAGVAEPVTGRGQVGTVEASWPGPVGAVTIAFADSGPAPMVVPDGVVHLALGVVPGAGAALVAPGYDPTPPPLAPPAGAAATEPVPASASATGPVAAGAARAGGPVPEALDVVGLGVGKDPTAAEPLPVAPAPPELRRAEPALGPVAAPVVEDGRPCPRGHFNDPRARFCAACRAAMAPATPTVAGPRPPLGVLIFDDGTTWALTADFVIGRQPDVSEAVQRGDALPLPVEDPERSLSRAHAQIHLSGWDVHFTNLSTTNGSFLWDAGRAEWRPLPTGEPLVLEPGARIGLGRRQAVYER